jgi:hypothetical protein
MHRFLPVTAVLLLCAAGAAPPAAARPRAHPVMSGAMDICKIIDGGDVFRAENGDEMCCAHEVRGDEEAGQGTGPLYCVRCSAEDPNDCELTTARPGPDSIETVLIRLLFARTLEIRAEEDKIRGDLADVLAALGQLQSKIEKVEAACSGDRPPATTPGGVE